MEDERVDTVGSRIRVARKAAGYGSAKSLAQAVTELAGRSISQQAIQKLEEDSSTSSWSIPYIGELTGCSGYWLLTGEDSVSGMHNYNKLSIENRRKIDEIARSFLALEQQEAQ